MDPIAKTRCFSQVVGLSGIVLLVAAWWLCLIQPMNQAAQEVELRRFQVQALRSQQPILLAALETSRVKAADWEEKKTRLLQRAKPAQDDIDFLNWAHEQATEVGLQLKDYRPSGKDILGDYEGRGLLLSANGSFDDICQFLERLRDCPRMNRITSVEITPQGQDRQFFSLSLRVVLFTLQPKST